MTRWIRNRPGPGQEVVSGLVAAAAAATVGAAVYYLVRLYVAREPMSDPESGEDRNSRHRAGSERRDKP